VKELLKRFKITNCKLSMIPVETGLKLYQQGDVMKVDEMIYRFLVRSLSYLNFHKCRNQICNKSCC
jgi:hypothetical protein